MCWHHRERARFASGEYRAIPALPEFAEFGIAFDRHHYLHVSTNADRMTDSMVAFTPSEEKGVADRQTVLAFGRYLRKYCGHLTDQQRQRVVVAFRAALDIKDTDVLAFATDRETINDIFETEMSACNSDSSSCMYGKFTDWEHRPYHVYADSPDVAVAYLKRNGKIVARSVVSTLHKKWVRAYAVSGDETLCTVLTKQLRAEGYLQGDLVGSRLTQLPESNGQVVLPYIDNGGMGVYERDGYWVVCDTSDAEYIGDDTGGYASEAEQKCERCDYAQGNCQCSYCECCDEYYADGCDNCSICEECERCTEHSECICERCEDCGRIIEPRSRYTARCRCERCDECNELTANCECEPEEDEETEDAEETASV